MEHTPEAECRMQLMNTPFKIGKLNIRNRFVMGPMSMAWETDNRGGYTDDAIAFFSERAKGGFGAIVTGGQSTGSTVNPMGRSGMRAYPEYYKERADMLINSVHAYDTKIFQEITFGVGRNYPGFKAPSVLPVFKYANMSSEALTVDEIHSMRDDMIDSARLAKEAGFDGMDIHTIHWGYLLDQFVLSITNKRTDEYGGSLDNRLRLLRETVTGIHQVCGDDFPVIIGLGVKSFIKALNKASLFGEEEAGRTVEEAVEIAKKLEEMGIAAIMTDVGIYDSFYHACPPSYMAHGHALELYRPVKEAVNIPVMGRSRLGKPEIAIGAVESGAVDAVVLARPALADAEFPNKVIGGQWEKIRPCIGCNMGCISRCTELFQHESCAANPRACYEFRYPEKKSAKPRKLAIVGGGAAGMQAALTAVECGHTAEIFEKTANMGGELNAAGAHDFKQDIHELRDWYVRELKEKNVPIHMNTEFSTELYEKGGFDTVILATGASAVMPASIGGIEKAMSAVDLLENERETGEHVVVVGAGMVGCETAVDLLQKGKKVTLVEALPDILSSEFVPQQHKMMLTDMLAHYGAEIITAHKLVAVSDEGAILADAESGEKMTVKADSVVLSIGLRPNPTIEQELTEKGAEVYKVGSANRAGNVIDSTSEAFSVVYNLD